VDEIRRRVQVQVFCLKFFYSSPVFDIPFLVFTCLVLRYGKNIITSVKMAEQTSFEKDNKVAAGPGQERDLETVPSAADGVAAIPKGTIDPVYEAKARVLNHAVGLRHVSSCRHDHVRPEIN